MRKIELILYILKSKHGRNKLIIILITIFQGLLIIGINNMQKIIIGVKQIAIVDIFLNLPFLYLYLFLSSVYLLNNLINFYKKRREALAGMSKLDKLVREDISVMKGDEYQLDKCKQTVSHMEKVEKKIREYITSTLGIILSLYTTLFIIILIEPIEIKQYYLFFAYTIINAILFYNSTHLNKHLIKKFDEIAPEYNRFLEQFLDKLKN